MEKSKTLNELIEEQGKKFEDEFCFRNVSQSSSYDIGGNHRAQEARDFLRTALKEIALQSIEATDSVEFIKSKVEHAQKYVDWKHTRGNHSDDFQDTEPCDCDRQEKNGKTSAYNNILKHLEEAKQRAGVFLREV